MANNQIPPWWVTHIRNNENSTLTVDTNMTSGLLGRSVMVAPVERPVTTDILSAFNSSETRPVNANSPLVSDPVLYINETWASWGEVSSARTQIPMGFQAYNPKPVPYTITEIRYTITMNDGTVGEGATRREYVIPPKSIETIDATTAINNQQLDEWWVSHLQNNQVTNLRIEFAETIELPTGETVEVPLNQLTYTEQIETNFFGNKPSTINQSSTNGGNQEDGNETTPPRTTTAGDGTPTATDTDLIDTGNNGSDESSPTPTPDDGLLENETVTATDIL